MNGGEIKMAKCGGGWVSGWFGYVGQWSVDVVDVSTLFWEGAVVHRA